MNKHIFIGCSGYKVGYWKGVFYPDLLSTAEYLSFYSERLNAVEINSTFYHRPRIKTLKDWRASTPQKFKFFIKIPKTITHINKIVDTATATTEFCSYVAEHLGDKLGGFLFQLPPSFHYSPENLGKVLATAHPEFPNVFEFRHASWWIPEVYSFLAHHQIAFSGVSIPRNIPADVISNLDQLSYYRLHGCPTMFKSFYTDSELMDLGEKIKILPGDSYIFFNNTNGIAAINNALFLTKYMGDDE